MIIISWNIYGLPWYISLNNPHDRIDRIIKKILDLNPCIICLQEVFIESIYNKLESEFDKKNYFVIKNIEGVSENCCNFIEPKSTTSGLFFAAKKQPIEYKFFNYINSCGEDSLISKGYAKIKINNSIMCYITHVQAENPIFSFLNSDRIIILQLDQLLLDINQEKIKKKILIGDFNIKNNSEQYNNFINNLKINNELVINKNNDLDYIIFLNLKSTNIEYELIDDIKLSDHPILKCNAPKLII